jgi:hypothetical protein
VPNMTDEQRQTRRFLRLAVTLEVEILDPEAARAAGTPFGVDGVHEPDDWAGELTPDEGAAVQVVQDLLTNTLLTVGPDAGITARKVFVQPRMLDSSGEMYQELVWPAESARRDDGTLP